MSFSPSRRGGVTACSASTTTNEMCRVHGGGGLQSREHRGFPSLIMELGIRHELRKR